MKLSMRLIIPALLMLIATGRGVADDLPRLYEGQSPDKRVDSFLFNKEGKLRFRFIEAATGKTLGDFISVYESIQRTNSRATDLAWKASVFWSPDSRYVILDEAFEGETSSGLIVVQMLPASTKQLALPLDRLASFLPKKYQSVTMDFDRWLGNRMFFAYLHGETIHAGAENEHVRIPLVFTIGKDDAITISNADE